ncbi:MAG: PAC2 family protein, partial [Chloroflexota bacterium]
MTLYHLEGAVRLDSPIVVAAFDGWVDGGRAGTLAADQLAAGGQPIATFDTDRIYDYRARRPTLQITNGKLMSLEWP